MLKRGVCKDFVANCVSDGRLRKAVKFGATEQEEKKRRRLKTLSEGRDLGKTTSHAASPRLPASAPSRARSLSSPFPLRSFLRRHRAPSLFLPSLADSTPDLSCYLQTFFPLYFYFFSPFSPLSLFLFGADYPKTSKQLTAAFASSSSRGSFAHRRGDATSVLTPFGRHLGDSSIPPSSHFGSFNLLMSC